jgi:hypothetical protein
VTALALAIGLGVASTASATCPPGTTAGPWCIDGTIADAGAGAGVADPHLGTKELGPINASTTKIGYINTAPEPMLGLTNPNASVDLNHVWVSSGTDSNGHIWIYFAWTRDSTSGSGFVSLEANVADPGCYPNGVLDPDCNPWKARANGDPLFAWDQQGNSNDIYFRVFDQTLNSGKGGFKTPASCPGTVEDLGCLLDPTVAVASYNSDYSGGELAIDLSALFTFSDPCHVFSNLIPGTVTGNSDSADYKDVVLAPLSIDRCGTVVVSKVTKPAGLSGTFTYTLDVTGNVFYSGAVDSDCNVSGSIAGVIPGTYSLAEDAAGGDWLTPTIVCTVPGDPNSPYTGTSFPVSVGVTTSCVITNPAKFSPTGATLQSSATRLSDYIEVSGILRASDETAMKVTFKLYNDSGCTNEVGTGPDIIANTNISLTFDNASDTSGIASTGASILVVNGTYHWRVTFSGNNYNNGFTTSCAGEVTTVSVLNSGSGS